MGEGTLVGTWKIFEGLGHALFHPIDTTNHIIDVLSTPPPTPAERAAQDTATLQRERSEQIAHVGAPFETSREGGYVVGQVFLAPAAAGRLIGVLTKSGVGALAERPSTPPVPGARVRVGEGSFAIAYREGDMIVKEVKAKVIDSKSNPVEIDAADRARLAKMTVDFANQVGDGVAGRVPKLIDEGNGVMRQPVAQGMTIQELGAANPSALVRASNAMADIRFRAARILGLKDPDMGYLETPDGWEIVIDHNESNFRFDRDGNIVSWFDPIAVYPPRAR
jgi:hypothetical protein